MAVTGSLMLNDSSMACPSISIIVNDYRKDISKLVTIASVLNANVYFYTKYESGETAQPIPETWHVEQFPNVGREGHTYISHMLSKPLGDINIFLQSDLDEDGETGDCDMMQRIEQSICMLEDPATAFVSLSHTKDSRLSELWPFNDHPDLKKLTKTIGWEGDATITFRGQFCVTRHGIEALTDRYFEFLCSLKACLEMSNNPIEGHCLERYWGIIFALAQNQAPTSVHIRSLVVHEPSWQLIGDHTLLLSVPESLNCNLQGVPSLAIQTAFWCTERALESIDVTEVLHSFAGTSFFATNSNLGDPMPGKPKILVIRFTLRHLSACYIDGRIGNLIRHERLPTLLNQSGTLASAQQCTPLVSAKGTHRV